MTQNEKVTVKLTLEMDVKSALINFDDCKTAEDIVDFKIDPEEWNEVHSECDKLDFINDNSVWNYRF